MPTYLILHGYGQSSAIMTKKMKELLPSGATLIVPNGPLVLEQGMRGWFPLSKEDLMSNNVTFDPSEIISFKFEITTFDAIIASSQGCSAAVTLLKHRVVSTPRLLLFSPFVSLECLGDDIKCRVYIGVKDTLVSPQYSKDCVGNKGEIVEHRWGHVIPSTKQYKQEYATFLTS